MRNVDPRGFSQPEAAYRLVSLLEILEIKAEAFWRLSSMVGQWLVRLETSFPSPESVGPALYELRGLAITLGIRGAVVQIDRINETVKSDQWSSLQQLATILQPLVRDLHLRIVDDLEDRFFLAIPSEKVSFFSQAEPLFGKGFQTKFPSAAFELDEAGKCLALSRPTASVFHCMRMMEIGIRATARCLGIPDPLKPAERNWGFILSEIKRGIDTKWPTTAERHGGEGALFESLYVSLDAVRNPWRNATMHVENKYTPEEAEHIFFAVRSFMTKLVSRLDENGKPLA